MRYKVQVEVTAAATAAAAAAAAAAAQCPAACRQGSPAGTRVGVAREEACTAACSGLVRAVFARVLASQPCTAATTAPRTAAHVSSDAQLVTAGEQPGCADLQRAALPAGEREQQLQQQLSEAGRENAALHSRLSEAERALSCSQASVAALAVDLRTATLAATGFSQAVEANVRLTHAHTSQEVLLLQQLLDTCCAMQQQQQLQQKQQQQQQQEKQQQQQEEKQQSQQQRKEQRQQAQQQQQQQLQRLTLEHARMKLQLHEARQRRDVLSDSTSVAGSSAVRAYPADAAAAGVGQTQPCHTTWGRTPRSAANAAPHVTIALGAHLQAGLQEPNSADTVQHDSHGSPLGGPAAGDHMAAAAAGTTATEPAVARRRAAGHVPATPPPGLQALDPAGDAEQGVPVNTVFLQGLSTATRSVGCHHTAMVVGEQRCTTYNRVQPAPSPASHPHPPTPPVTAATISGSGSGSSATPPPPPPWRGSAGKTFLSAMYAARRSSLPSAPPSHTLPSSHASLDPDAPSNNDPLRLLPGGISPRSSPRRSSHAMVASVGPGPFVCASEHRLSPARNRDSAWPARNSGPTETEVMPFDMDPGGVSQAADQAAERLEDCDGSRVGRSSSGPPQHGWTGSALYSAERGQGAQASGKRGFGAVVAHAASVCARSDRRAASTDLPAGVWRGGGGGGRSFGGPVRQPAQGLRSSVGDRYLASDAISEDEESMPQTTTMAGVASSQHMPSGTWDPLQLAGASGAGLSEAGGSSRSGSKPGGLTGSVKRKLARLFSTGRPTRTNSKDF
ncbi:MAG: hypothetical protein WDW36_009101 [Sanguina aurantia]